MDGVLCLKATREVILKLSPDRKQMAALVNGVPVRIEDLKVYGTALPAKSGGLHLRLKVTLANGEELLLSTWRPLPEGASWPLTVGPDVGRADWALRGVLGADLLEAPLSPDVDRAYDWTEFEVPASA